MKKCRIKTKKGKNRQQKKKLKNCKKCQKLIGDMGN